MPGECRADEDVKQNVNVCANHWHIFLMSDIDSQASMVPAILHFEQAPR